MWAVILGISLFVLIVALVGKAVFVTVIENEHTFFWLAIGFVVVYILIALLISKLNPVRPGPSNISSFFTITSPRATSTR